MARRKPDNSNAPFRTVTVTTMERQIQAVREALMASTVSAHGKTIEIECFCYETKRIILDWLGGTTGQISGNPPPADRDHRLR